MSKIQYKLNRETVLVKEDAVVLVSYHRDYYHETRLVTDYAACSLYVNGIYVGMLGTPTVINNVTKVTFEGMEVQIDVSI